MWFLIVCCSKTESNYLINVGRQAQWLQMQPACAMQW